MLRQRFRRGIVMVSVAVVGASGLAVASAGSAVAGVVTHPSTLTCTPDTGSSGAPVLHCTATDPNGVKSIHATAQDTGFSPNFGVAAVSQPCSPAPSDTLTLTFVTFFAPRYQVVVADCAGLKDVYRVSPDGTVKFVRTKGSTA